MIYALIIFLAILFWTGFWLLLKGYLPVTDRFLTLLGTLLMVLSVLMPLLMVIMVLPSIYFLNFLSYEFILLGMMFLVFGIGGLGRYRTVSISVAELAEYRQSLARLKLRTKLGSRA